MAKGKDKQIQYGKFSSCYRPKGNVNADNPPQSGTGVPKKPKENK
jgi:hypothetical protein